MTKPRISIEIVSNPKVRVYNVSREISLYPIHIFYRPLTDKSHQKLNEVGEAGTQLLRELFDLPGVNTIFISPYELQVEKAKLFGWEDIEPRIMEALKKTFREEADSVEIIKSHMPDHRDCCGNSGMKHTVN